MKKRTGRITAGILSAALVSGLLFQAVSARETESETETAQAIVMGAQESDEDYQVTLVNESGKEIKEVSIRASYGDFSENLLPAGETLEDKEQGVLWCTPAEIINFVPPVYDIRLTFSDDESATLHTLPFGDTEELKIRTDEESGTVYVNFFSFSLNSETDSLTAEKNIASSGEDAMIRDYQARTGQTSDQDSQEGLMRQLAAGGFRDITRIASSSPDMWESICLENSGPLLDAIDIYDASLQKVADAIRTGSGQSLHSFFQSAKDYRDDMPSRMNGSIMPAYEIYADIIDESGAIATIATILASNGINIKNIGIIHNREFEEGVLRISFYDADAAEKAALLMAKFSYNIRRR